MSRVIDFALVRDVDVHTTAGDWHGSDHRVVVFDCLHGRKRLRIGLWNVERDRNRQLVVGQVHDVMALHQLDALLVCEASDYIAALRAERSLLVRPTAGVTSERSGSTETCIVVRPGVDVGSGWIVRLTRAGWITVRGGRTAPKWMPTVLLDGWLRVAVVHTPPSCRFRNGKHGPVGPVRRVAAYVALMRRVRTFARRRPGGRSLLIAGDWNATPASRGTYSPAWLARSGRLRIAKPKVGTHR